MKKVRITYYNPRTKVTSSAEFPEGWQALAFAKKVKREGSYVRKTETIEVAEEPNEPEPAA